MFVTTTCNSRLSDATVNSIYTGAHGRFKPILLSAGVEERVLETRNVVCPWCGGEDRFSFTDKFGNGDSYCRGCGYHSGIDFLMKVKNIGYRDALLYIAAYLNVPIKEVKTVSPKKTVPRPLPVEKIWSEAHAIGENDSAFAYLRSRGLRNSFPSSLRAVNDLRYAQPSADGKTWEYSFHEGLLAEIVNSDGKRVSLHRTYLDNGRKARVKTVKKVLGKELSGCVVRLSDLGEEGVLGLAEGIETALSASELFGVPVWSVVAAFNFKNFVPPKGVRKVIIFADADANFVGQREAYAGASEIIQRHPEIEVEVRLPETIGKDWNDVLLSEISGEGSA